MKRLRDILELILLFLFIGFILLLAWFTIHGARKVKQIGEDLDRTIIIIAGAATNVEIGARQWKKQSEAQASGASETFQNLNAAAKSLNGLISSTDKSLNVSLLPNLSAAIKEQNDALLKTQSDFQANLAAIGQVTAHSQTMIDNANDQITNPAIKESVDSLATSMQNTAVATDQAAKAMMAVRSGIEYEVAQIEKPVTKVKVIFLFILTALGRFFGFA